VVSARRPSVLRASAIAFVLAASAVGAEEAAPRPSSLGDPVTTPPAASAPAAEAVEPARSFGWGRFDLNGRVLLLGHASSESGQTTTDTDIDEVRLQVRWRPSKSFTGVLEGAAMEDRHLKDAYVAVRAGRFEARIGQFKPPISSIENTSRLRLPAVDRGLLSQVLEDAFGVAGRRPGVQLEWDQKNGPLRALAGVFRASNVRGDRIGDESFDNFARDWSQLKTTVRLARATKRLEIGASFDVRPAEPVPGEGYRRFWTGAADLSWSARAEGPRAWLEGYAGRSWQDATPFDGQDATFLAGRTIAGWRFGAERTRRVTFEPYVSAGLLDPDASVREDLLWEIAGGVHLTSFGHLRLDLEAQRRAASRNTPLSLGIFAAGPQPGGTRTRLVVLLGAAF
jgi:hypothetical protein